ncbi:glycosyltransferase family 2 protein [Echinicola strongylocentroti]|uniref:Glycosyltransferase family 2 protein n=1 Tax=Echinicola strongylocentroti TaxID=1795355 RepID=A0A2Z4IIR0_9BACT|nr:glycosyltransferase family 2 protein [Echinicola strongylocentroti]AWW30607.1 glycosyltransferase family 2 protein [Echinicola strongylocentroti]
MASISGSSVAIIVLNWNGYEHTRNCLHSLRAVEGASYDVILVDNASTDGSVIKLEKDFPEPDYLVNEKNLGFTGGNNVGINYALDQGYGYIMLLNNDTEVTPSFLKKLIDALEHTPDLGAVQPMMYYLHDRSVIWNAGGKFRPWTGASVSIRKAKLHAPFYPTDWITGCCLLVKSSVIREVGLLNDHYFAYFEDVDWSLRMREKGYQLAVVPSSIIYHEAGASSKAKKKNTEGILNPKVHYLNTRNQLFQLRNHVRFPYCLLAWPIQLIKLSTFGLYFLARLRKQKLHALLRGVKDGLLLEC